MNILSIDTTTKNACCAIQTKKDNEVITIEQSISNEITHSEKLLPLIDDMLKNGNISLDDISMFACITGPGSFTGIRIGLATIKAFAQIKNIDIFAMTTLEAICYKAYAESKYFEDGNTTYIASFIDAKNDRVYFALYKILKNLNGKITISKELDMSNQLIDNSLNTIKEKLMSLDLESSYIIFTGDCINKFKCNIDNLNINDSIKNLDLVELYPTPRDIIDASYILANKENYIYTAYTLDATYARLSQAERVKDGKD